MAVKWEQNGVEMRGPSWSELVDQATNILGFKAPELARVRGTDLQILEYFKLCNSNQIAKLTNWLSIILNPPDAELRNSAIHRELAALDLCKIFYTTNYDDFLERALALHGRTCNTVAVEAQMGRKAGDCEIIKFHGDLNHPDQIVLTESDYEERLRLSGPMDFRLRSDLLGRVIVFLGYSFRDPNISYLFRLFTDDIAGMASSLSGARAYILVPDPSDFERRLFEARKITVIPIDGSRKEDEISAFLADLRS